MINIRTVYRTHSIRLTEENILKRKKRATEGIRKVLGTLRRVFQHGGAVEHNGSVRERTKCYF